MKLYIKQLTQKNEELSNLDNSPKVQKYEQKTNR